MKHGAKKVENKETVVRDIGDTVPSSNIHLIGFSEERSERIRQKYYLKKLWLTFYQNR